VWDKYCIEIEYFCYYFLWYDIKWEMGFFGFSRFLINLNWYPSVIIDYSTLNTAFEFKCFHEKNNTKTSTSGGITIRRGRIALSDIDLHHVMTDSYRHSTTIFAKYIFLLTKKKILSNINHQVQGGSSISPSTQYVPKYDRTLDPRQPFRFQSILS